MERVRKENGSRDFASPGRVAQGRFARDAVQNDFVSRIDNSPHMIAQRRKLQGMFGGTIQLQEAEEEPLQGKFTAVQRVEEEEPLQGKFETVQMVEEEEPLQGKFERVTGSRELVHLKVDPTTTINGVPVNDDQSLEHEADSMGAKAAQFVTSPEEEPLQAKFGQEISRKLDKTPNNTGLPDNLKAGVENLSGMSMDGVKVHYNSDKPAQLNALAYAQGTDIHVGPGQEQHLPHEAWHVVQQGGGHFSQLRRNSHATAPSIRSKLIQLRADTSGYNLAPTVWTAARLHANAFADAIHAMPAAHGCGATKQRLEENITAKSNKAGGTCLGEAYEALSWDATDPNNVAGPGYASGIDIVKYGIGTHHHGFEMGWKDKEIKSAESVDSAKAVFKKAKTREPDADCQLYIPSAILATVVNELLAFAINVGVRVITVNRIAAGGIPIYINSKENLAHLDTLYSHG